MPRYIVRETVTLIRYIEAESESEAIAKVREMGVGDFEEVDCSEPECITATRDTSED